MSREDEKAARALRRATLASINAKREARIKQIQEIAQEQIREVNIKYVADPERIKAKYLYKKEAARERIQKRADKKALDMRRPKRFTIGEEIFSSVSNGIGAGLSAAAIVMFIVRAVEYAPANMFFLTLTSFILFGSVLAYTFLMATLQHALTPYNAKRIFSVFTASSAYLLLAFTYVPFSLLFIKGALGWTLVGILWGLTALGITLYAVFEKKLFKFSVIIFVVMVLLELSTVGILSKSVAPVSMIFVWWGIIAYVLAGIFFCMKDVKWMHCIFHLFVLIGAVCHFFAVFYSIPLAL